jgi:hypothetical protein
MEGQIKEEVENANCNICRYVFFDKADREEQQKCRVLTIKTKPPVNTALLEYILQNQKKEIKFCEYFDKK